MTDKIKNILIGGLLITTILFGIKACDEKETIKVNVPVEIEVPVVKKEFDTVYLPKPYKVEIDSPINKELEVKLKEAITTIDSLKTYKDFAVKRTYSEVFEDSVQTITVNAETTGTLDKLQATYKTKPRTITDVVEVEVKVPYKTKFAIGAELGIPISGVQEIYNTPTQSIVIKQDYVGKANLFLDTKKIIYSASIDTEKRGWVGLAYKF